MSPLKQIAWITYLISLSINAYAQTPQDWRPLDPDNTLLIHSTKGDIYIEMRPEIAPKAVERIKKLTREKIYDGLQFHRVIPQFVAQTGNPNNKDGGGTSYPNLPPEMVFRLPLSNFTNIASDSSDSASGFIGSVPFQSLPLSSLAAQTAQGKPTLRSWGAHCAGTAGMGRNEPRDSANSELYFMLAATRRLDRDYTPFGRVVIGFDVLLKLAHGEPPAQPDLMQSVQILADIPAEKRPKVSVASTAKMQELIDKARQEKGADFSVCDVPLPAKVE
ncbi:MAG: peptidylprolyl isomerase [Burkholderiales bacterium]|nr:peptidylprolyl isomerase [Burkholderiales bacterium]